MKLSQQHPSLLSSHIELASLAKADEVAEVHAEEKPRTEWKLKSGMCIVPPQQTRMMLGSQHEYRHPQPLSAFQMKNHQDWKSSFWAVFSSSWPC